MEIREVAVFTAGDEEELVEGEPEPWGTERLGIAWKPKDRHVLLVEDGRLLARAGYVPIEIEASGTRMDGLGLGGVMVRRTSRGRGIGERLVRETVARMGDTGRPFAMLFCRDVRLAFYERLGWTQLQHEVTVDQEEGPLVMPLLTCWYSLDGETPPPSGDLRLLGLPF